MGGTNEVASILRRPVAASLSISSVLMAVETCVLIFCRPSRGATSKMRTAAFVEALDVDNGLLARNDEAVHSDSLLRLRSAISLLLSNG